MKAVIITIGPYSFALELTTVAVSIQDALKSAPVVELVAEQNGRGGWRESRLPAPTISVMETTDLVGSSPDRIFTTNLSRAVLAHLPRSRRSTFKALAEAGRCP